MSYLQTLIELAEDIKKYFREEETKLSEDIKKKKQEAKNKKCLEKYQEVKRALKRDELPLLVQVLKWLSNIREDNFSKILTEVFLETDKFLHEKVRELEENYQKCIRSPGLELLPETLLENFPAANNSKSGFNGRFYYEILPLMELVRINEKVGIPEVHAFKICVLFDSKADLLEYFKSFERANKGSIRLLHDSCLFDLPSDNPKWRLGLWKTLSKELLSNGKFRKLLSFAGKIEIINPSISEQTTISELYDTYAKVQYERAHVNPEAAILFFKNGIPEESFNKYLDEILPNAEDSTRIPDVGTLSISDKKSKSSFYLKKLDPRNPLAPILGRKTNCCQLVGGAGEPCAIHGITSEEGGFYVVYEGDPNNTTPNDEVISQSWVWRSKNQALVLDSIEFSINIRNKTQKEFIIKLYIDLANHLISNSSYEIHLVTVGTNGETPDDFGITGVGLCSDQFAVLEEPIDYNGYRDSKIQRLIAVRDIPFYKEFSENISENLFLAKFKHWIQSFINRKDILEKVKKLVLEERSKELDEIIEISSYLQLECQKEMKDINWGELDKYSKSGYCLDLPGIAGMTLLERAFYKEDLLRIEWLLKHGSKVEKLTQIIQARHYTPYFILIKAALSKQWGLVRLLVEGGVDTELAENQYSEWKSILSVSINQGNLDETQWLLNKGMNVNDCDLEKAVENGYWDILDHIFECRPLKKNKILLFASKKEKWEKIKEYIEKGAISVEEPFEATALNIAAEKRQWGTVQLYIDNTAFQGVYALTDTLYWALKSGNWDMSLQLISKGADGNIAMLYLAEHQEWEKVKKLILSNQAKVNACYNGRQDRYPEIKGCNDSTALMKAGVQEDTEMIGWLLTQGASLPQRNSFGVTCFFRVFQDKKIKSIEFLLYNYVDYIQDDLLSIIIQEITNGANTKKSSIQSENNNGSVNPNVICWDFLIKFVSDINAIDNCYGQTILTAICSQGKLRWEMVEEVVKFKNININAKNKNGDTPLHCLCRQHSVSLEKIQWFCKLGAETHEINNKKESTVCASLDIFSNFEVACWLVDQGVDDINTTYATMVHGDGETMVLKACFYGELNLVKDLVSKKANIKHKNSHNQDNAVIISVRGHENLELLEWLIFSMNLDVNEKNKSGETALLVAASRWKWTVVKKLVTWGANINVAVSKEIDDHFSFLNKSPRKKIRTDTLLQYAFDAYSDKDRWENVEWVLSQPNVDLTSDGVHSSTLKQIEEFASDNIKKLLKEKQGSALKPQILMLSNQGQNVVSQRVDPVVTGSSNNEATNKLAI